MCGNYTLFDKVDILRVEYFKVNHKTKRIKEIIMEQNRQMSPRAIKTRAAIQKAFEEMVCEMNPDDITVKELTERAHIHRKTFYLHFTCIEALYEDTLHNLSQKYFESVEQIPVPNNIYDLTRILFDFCSGNEFIECLYCNENYRSFSNAIMIAALKHNREIFNPYAAYTKEEQNMINTYLTSGSLDLFRQWVKDGKVISKERAVELTSRLLGQGIENITNCFK